MCTCVCEHMCMCVCVCSINTDNTYKEISNFKYCTNFLEFRYLPNYPPRSNTTASITSHKNVLNSPCQIFHCYSFCICVSVTRFTFRSFTSQFQSAVTKASLWNRRGSSMLADYLRKVFQYSYKLLSCHTGNIRYPNRQIKLVCLCVYTICVFVLN